MKICIDVSPIIYGTGVSVYTTNLVKSLIQIDKRNDYTLFGGSLRRYFELKNKAQNLGSVDTKIFPFPPTLLDYWWNSKHKFPIEKFVGKIDVLHSSDWTQPPSRAYNVTTIHDLVPIRFSDISHPKIVTAHKKRLEWVKREVDKIIAVSEFTKQEIIELLDISPQKIVVIPEACDPSIKKPSKEEVEKVLKKFNINKFLLVVGADPRKNIPQIISAFDQVRKNYPELELVITGRLWDNLQVTDGVKLLGHVSRNDLTSLYAAAQALVYTSSYEGFGLPILEAMKLDCPVVTSNISSMPEVAGRSAVLVEPKDPENISKGIEKVLSDRFLWISRGRKRVKEFSWIDSAEKTLKVYQSTI